MKRHRSNSAKKIPALVLAALLVEIPLVKSAGAKRHDGQSGATKTLKAFTDPARRTIDGGALIEEAPRVTRGAHGWDGYLWLDGYPVTIISRTQLLAAPASTSFRFWNLGGLHVHAKLQGRFVNDPISSALLKPNTWATYHVTRASDGSVVATQLRLWPNQVDASGRRFLRIFTARIQAPDYDKSIPGSIQFGHGSPVRILPDQSVQAFVSRLGMGLVPQYQRELPAKDPTKIDFHFYVVRPFVDEPGNRFVQVDGELPTFGFFAGSHYTYNSPRRNTIVENLIALPDGAVLIPDVVLAKMRDRSQLAALLSYAITSIVQRQAYTAWPLITSPRARRFNVHPSSISAFAYWQDEQVIRIGIRQMYLAGYDIREAPYAWAVAQGKPVNNPVIDSEHPDKEIPWYAAYAFHYISQYYKDVDYSKLKRGEKEYQQFLAVLRKADPGAFAPQKADSKRAKKEH